MTTLMRFSSFQKGAVPQLVQVPGNIAGKQSMFKKGSRD
jgi:hypothetical protein